MQYPWIPEGSPLQRDWLPGDLAPLLAAQGLNGCVAVQARQTLEESRWLLSLAAEAEIIRGVVGWVDLRSDRVEEEIEPLARNPRFAGVRHVVQDEAADFMLGAAFQRGIGRLKGFDLTYDVLIFPQHLPSAIALAEKFPEQPFVVDHLAKPLIRDGVMEPWREDIRELAKAPNVMCKVSGMVTEARHDAWKPADFRPYLDVVFEAFGEDRLMFGSDWPVCLLAGSYGEIHGLLADYAAQSSPAAREKLFGGNCGRFYGVSVSAVPETGGQTAGAS